MAFTGLRGRIVCAAPLTIESHGRGDMLGYSWAKCVSKLQLIATCSSRCRHHKLPIRSVRRSAEGLCLSGKAKVEEPA